MADQPPASWPQQHSSGILMDIKDIKEEMLKILNDVSAPGSFASFQKLPRPVPGSILVHGIGHVPTPLSETTAQQVIAQCRRAPFGKGSETVVDTSVRDTWELDTSQFTLQGDEWASFVESVTFQAAKGLGIDQPIKAEPYKMLLYEKGAMFKPHADSEKIPRMFGTLVICLPSGHTGGDVVVQHCGKKQAFATSIENDTFLCWYSDVTHEVRPVESGYRWVLTYNLALEGDQSHASAAVMPPPSAALLQKCSPAARLQNVLKKWLSGPRNDPECQFMYHVFDHDYTEANFSFAALKTYDRARVEALKEATRGLPVDIFLALLEREERGETEPENYGPRGWDEEVYSSEDNSDSGDDGSSQHHDIDDIIEENYRAKDVYSLEGRCVAENLFLHMDQVTDPGIWDDLEVFDEEYQGYTGNEGSQAIHWYRVSAVAVVPRDAAVDFFTRSEYELSHCNDVEDAVRHYTSICLESGSKADRTTVDVVENLCAATWQGQERHVNNRGLSQGALALVMRVALQQNRLGLFNKAVAKSQGVMPANFWTEVRKWLDNDSDEQLLPRFAGIKDILRDLVAATGGLSERLEALQQMIPQQSEQPQPDCLRDWMQSCLIGAVKRNGVTKDPRDVDGRSMVDAALRFDDPKLYLDTIKNNVDATYGPLSFMVALINRFHDHVKYPGTGEAFRSQCCELYQHFMNVLADSDEHEIFQNLATTDNISRLPIAQPHAHHVELSRLFLNASLFATTEPGEHVATRLASKIIAQIPQAPVSDLPHFWTGFLHDLVPEIRGHLDKPATTAMYQDLFTTVLSSLMDRYVGREPVCDRDLRRPRVGCGCADCDWLDNFLVDPGNEFGYFPANENRRRHLQYKLYGIDCSHDTQRRGSPYTLVVKKTFTAHDQALKEWQHRYSTARAKLDKFKKEDMEKLLGDKFESIYYGERLDSAAGRSVGGSSSRTSTGGAARSRPQQPLAASRPGSLNASSSSAPQRAVSGTKRKEPPTAVGRREDVEVVDLTSD